MRDSHSRTLRPENPLASLRLIILPGEFPDPQMKPYYDRAFQHWNAMWSKTFGDQDGLTRLYSDNFTRQSEILAFFDGLTCVSLLCMRQADLSASAIRKDSYFQAWPEEALEQLAAHGSRAVIGSQISILPEWRGRQGNQMNLKDLVSALSLWRLRMLDVDVMPATVRVDRSMQTLFLQCGAECLKENVDFHHSPVDLLAVYPQAHPIHLPEELEEVLGKLWDRRRGGSPLDLLTKDSPASFSRRRAG